MANMDLALLSDVQAIPIRTLTEKDTLTDLPSGVYFRSATNQLPQDLPTTAMGILLKWRREDTEQMAWYLDRKQGVTRIYARVRSGAVWSAWQE